MGDNIGIALADDITHTQLIERFVAGGAKPILIGVIVNRYQRDTLYRGSPGAIVGQDNKPISRQNMPQHGYRVEAGIMSAGYWVSYL